ncbi:TPA: hypothetical protein H1016_05190 [archaeon]|uniref:Uncharacterized protein n=1 Tax=Candidatus Naiadarchaeum limnaeum TaxID=2756139 RepID=A0A832UPA1_9ARCH|nr:hypothetical protein [Candidatus Naiadarchaeum limnaeum]
MNKKLIGLIGYAIGCSIEFTGVYLVFTNPSDPLERVQRAERLEMMFNTGLGDYDHTKRELDSLTNTTEYARDKKESDKRKKEQNLYSLLVVSGFALAYPSSVLLTKK